MAELTPPRLPIWVRIATAPLWLRAGVWAALAAAYFVLFALGDAGLRYGLRPANLLLVLIAGLLFGMWRALALATPLVFINVWLYWREGILFGEHGETAGNFLAIFVGILVGGLVGKARDLGLQLRAEVDRRILAERRKEELTALLVHDLKNPLAGIMGHAELLKLADLTAGELAESSDAIYESAQRMRRMVMNLLDIGRAEDGELHPRREEVDLERLVDEVRRSVLRQIADRRQRLEVHAQSKAGVAHVDPDLVRRMLLNLVDNAMKYSPPERTIRIELGGDPENVEIAVRDEGAGIPSGAELKVFEKYARLSRDAATEVQTSRGLGLLFCRIAADAHGGRVWVEPSPPRGSVFRLRLPRGHVGSAAH